MIKTTFTCEGISRYNIWFLSLSLAVPVETTLHGSRFRHWSHRKQKVAVQVLGALLPGKWHFRFTSQIGAL